MTSARIPGTGAIWRRGVLVLAVVLAPMLGLALAVGEDLLRVTESIDTLIVGPAALVSALACYAAWRIHPRPGLAFATIGLAVLGFQELARAGALLVSSEPVTGFRVLEGDVWQMLVVVVIVAVAHHLGRRPDPAAIGFGLGALVAASRLAGMDAYAELGQHPQRWAVCVVYVVVVLGLAVVVSRGGKLAPQRRAGAAMGPTAHRPRHRDDGRRASRLLLRRHRDDAYSWSSSERRSAPSFS